MHSYAKLFRFFPIPRAHLSVLQRFRTPSGQIFEHYQDPQFEDGSQRPTNAFESSRKPNLARRMKFVSRMSDRLDL